MAKKYEEIKEIEPMQLGRMLGILGIIAGIIMGALYSLAGLAMGAPIVSVATALGGIEPTTAMILSAGFFSILLLPLVWGIGGFLAGVIGATIFNLLAQQIGGIRITMK